jgi:hypothetical protein
MICFENVYDAWRRRVDEQYHIAQSMLTMNGKIAE